MAKKNIRKIPKSILHKLENIESQYVVVGLVKTFDKSYILEGNLSHLNINIDDTSLTIPNEVIPAYSQGRYSDKNINGEEIVRKDLPKETHYRSMEVPTWGSTWHTHTVNMPYEMYPRDIISPKLSSIKIECQNKSIEQDKFIIKFELSEVLNRETETFNKDLFSALNLLQENIYSCDVYPSNSTFEDYLRTTQLAWEFLPPGNKEDDIKRVFGRSTPTVEQMQNIEDRYDFIISLNPKELLYGTSGLQRYFGALLDDDLVVFENIRYGNALYIMHSDWQELSALSRIELMSGRYGNNFERVIHTPGWENKVRDIVHKYTTHLDI